MARFLGRIGTTPMKFQFEMTLEECTLSAAGPPSISVKWTRGPRTVQSTEAPGTSGKYKWDPASSKPLTIMSTLFKDSSSGKFQSKPSAITVVQTSGSKKRDIAVVEVDLAQFASIDSKFSLELRLTKCVDRNAKIKFTVQSRWLKELQTALPDDTASAVTDLSSIDLDMQADHSDIANLRDFDDFDDDSDALHSVQIACGACHSSCRHCFPRTAFSSFEIPSAVCETCAV